MKWVCVQKTYSDPYLQGRDKVYLPGDVVTLPDDATPPGHVWVKVSEYVSPSPPQRHESQMKTTTFGPSMPPVDAVKAANQAAQKKK